MTAPLFTIVVPAFNAAETLPETLAAIRAQTCKDWEALLIDDGSTDATPLICAEAARKDSRFRAIRNPGKGPSAARNLALTEARGEFLAFCDADDIWMPLKLTLSQAAFARSHVAAVYGQIAFFSGRRARTLSQVPPGRLTIAQLLAENPVCTLSNLCIRSEAFRATGGFDETLVHNEDLEWLIRLVGDGHAVHGIDACLVRYRTNPTGLSSDLARMQAGRGAALATAARFGVTPDARAEAIYLRYLSRRALRIGAPPVEALKFAAEGLRRSPAGFFSDLRRGGMTLAAACLAPLLPRAARARLFAA